MKNSYVRVYSESVHVEMVVADNDDLEIIKATFDKVLRDCAKIIKDNEPIETV